MTISNQIKVARNKAGLTQAELSLAIGYKTNVVWMWENERSTPTLDDLEKLKKVLKIKQFKI